MPSWDESLETVSILLGLAVQTVNRKLGLVGTDGR